MFGSCGDLANGDTIIDSLVTINFVLSSQDPVTRARTAISQDNGRSDPKTIALQHTTATHLTDTDRVSQRIYVHSVVGQM